MTRTIRSKEAQRTLDFDVDQSRDFVARTENVRSQNVRNDD